MKSTHIRKAFIEKYRKVPRLFRSPGRINLIGEHTDYNDGLVLPASVDKAAYFALAPRPDERVVLYAVDLDETYAFDLSDLSRPDRPWPIYQLSVLDQLNKNGHAIGGFEAAFGADVPSGAGMSSSAALECGLLFGLNELFNLGLDRLSIVRMAQRAENEYVGVNCGIMDQFASVFGQPDSVIRLDCRSLEYRHFPFPLDNYLLVLCDTQVKHSLADSAYNQRRRECERGVEVLQKYHPEIKSLRDATPAWVEEHAAELGDEVYKRCRYVTREIRRVEQACDMLLVDDMAGFGQKMYETHHGLQHDYEVSCPELDFLVDQTRADDGVLGARMMGGGFGGCTLNLVDRRTVGTFEHSLQTAYREQFGVEPPCYRVTITGGTSELNGPSVF